MYTVFDSMSFISVASEPVRIVLKCQSRLNRKHSNAKMLPECGYCLCEFAQVAGCSATLVLRLSLFVFPKAHYKGIAYSVWFWDRFLALDKGDKCGVQPTMNHIVYLSLLENQLITSTQANGQI